MEHYVTLFDSAFLPQGLALHESLETHGSEYTLWLLCLDDETYRVLGDLGLPNMRLVRIADVETAELLRVKPGRSRVEYCWTLTPFAPAFVFAADPTVARVTYVEADLWLLRSPAPIFRELDASGANVLITRHAFAPEHDQSATSGIYCVQFMTFTRGGGEIVRSWWQERCLEWCFARYEDGKFGDQKYLDDWPSRFPGEVHVLEHPESTLAPWNATRFPYSEATFYHFHGLRLERNRRVHFGAYPLPPVLIGQVYEPYLRALRRAVAALESVGWQFQPQRAPRSLMAGLRARLAALYAARWRIDIGKSGSL